MTKAEIIADASKLKSCSENSAAEYENQSAFLIVLLNKRLEELPERDTLIGKENLQMMRDNHNNHARFMSAIMKNYNPTVFVETILWVFRAYKNHGFSTNYWYVQLQGWIDILTAELSRESQKDILPFYHWMLSHIPQLNDLSKETSEEE